MMYFSSTIGRRFRSSGITGFADSPFFPSQIMGAGRPLSLNNGHAVGRLVPGLLDTPPLVETLIVWQSALRAAQVPLAVQGGGVACVGKEFGDGVFPGRQTGKPLSGERYREGSRANRIPPRHYG